MVSELVWRSCRPISVPIPRCRPSLRPIACARRRQLHHGGLRRQADNASSSRSPSAAQNEPTTHFGYETVAESLKESRVGAVFSSVASSYDTMNDLMSLGIHRLWKDHFVRSLNPGVQSLGTGSESKGWNILDIAGGTGDIAFRLLDHATHINNDHSTHVTVSDINPDMLAAGRARALSTPYYSSSSTSHTPPSTDPSRLSFLEANAEDLSMIPSNSIDLYTVAFGIRNFTSKRAALHEAFRVLKPGGVFACLEFSKVHDPAAPGSSGPLEALPSKALDAIYKRWSFGAIPLIGQLVAGDRDSYQYLVESIDQFPSQREFAGMISEAGFLLPGNAGGAERDEKIGKGGAWEDLTGGIAAIHKGVKPI